MNVNSVKGCLAVNRGYEVGLFICQERTFCCLCHFYGERYTAKTRKWSIFKLTDLQSVSFVED